MLLSGLPIKEIGEWTWVFKLQIDVYKRQPLSLVSDVVDLSHVFNRLRVEKDRSGSADDAGVRTVLLNFFVCWEICLDCKLAENTELCLEHSYLLHPPTFASIFLPQV